MSDTINTTTVVIKRKIGSWKYAKDLLEDWGEKSSEKYAKSISKKTTCRYLMFKWLEENNRIENHTLKENTSVCIPKDSADFEKIVSTTAPLVNISSKTIAMPHPIEFDDCVIFQHRQYPGKDKENKNEPAEDIISGDMNAEEIVKKNPMLFSFFKDLLHFKNLREELVSKGLPTEDYVRFQQIQTRIDALLESIVESSKQEMEALMKMCSVKDWEKLAMKLYKKFCSNDSSDYEDDPLLNRLFVGHKKTQTCITEFKERFEKYIKKYDYDIVSFNIEDFHKSIYGEYTKKGEEGVHRPKFGDLPNVKELIPKMKLSELKKLPEFKDALKGPLICFHDTQGFNVDAKEIKIKNGTFSCKLVFDFYDHFGLDSEDIKKFGESIFVGTGFQGWYILQHFNECETGCKAFVDHAKHEEWVEIKIEE